MKNTATATGFDQAAHPRNDATGQFVETLKADPGNDLLSGDAQRFDWIPDDELVATTARLAGYAVGRAMSSHKIIDLTVEDVQSEVLLAVMQRRRRQVGNAEASDEETVTVPEDSSERAWAYSVAKSVAARLRARVTNSADWGALAEFNSRSWHLRRELGRSLSEREKDALADEIRMSRPPRRRPSTDFHRVEERFPSSLDATLSGAPDGDTTFADRLAAGDDTETEAMFAYEHHNDPTAREFEAGSYGDQAMAMLDSGVRRNHGPSKIAYLALAERRNAPMPAELSLREDQATAAKRVVKTAGGPVEIARRIVDGRASSKEVAALMAAFPESDRKRADDFADVLLAYPEFAEDVWAGTIQYATIRNPRARLNKTTTEEGAVA